METAGLRRQDQDPDSGPQKQESKRLLLVLTHTQLIELLVKVPLFTCDIVLFYFIETESCSSGWSGTLAEENLNS